MIFSINFSKFYLRILNASQIVFRCKASIHDILFLDIFVADIHMRRRIQFWILYFIILIHVLINIIVNIDTFNWIFHLIFCNCKWILIFWNWLFDVRFLVSVEFYSRGTLFTNINLCIRTCACGSSHIYFGWVCFKHI